MPVIDPRDEIARLTAELAASKERERVWLAFADAYVAWAAATAGSHAEGDALCVLIEAYQPVEKMRVALTEQAGK